MTEKGPSAPKRPSSGPEADAGEVDFAGPEADTDEAVVPEREGPVGKPSRGRRSGRGATAAGSVAGGGATARPGERSAGRASPAAVPTPSEQAVHIEDRASRIFVIVAIGTFAVIFLNALLLGQGGPLAPGATPTPEPTPAVSPSASAAPSAGASGAASSASPVVSGSPAPSGS